MHDIFLNFKAICIVHLVLQRCTGILINTCFDCLKTFPFCLLFFLFVCLHVKLYHIKEAYRLILCYFSHPMNLLPNLCVSYANNNFQYLFAYFIPELTNLQLFSNTYKLKIVLFIT